MGKEVPGLLIGRGGSKGLPGKNTMEILGRPLMVYPILAAENAELVDPVYLSTEDSEIKRIGRGHGLEIIDRPEKLATDDALVEDVVAHGFEHIIASDGPTDIFVLLFCNSATITPGILDEGIERLREDDELDSAVTVSRYNEYSPVRAMKINDGGLLEPFVDVSQIPNASSSRNSQADCYFCDCSAWILRSRCVAEDLGGPPFPWIGEKVLPLEQDGALDIDHNHGVPRTQHWLRKHGFGEDTTPYN